jgi:hypothetical protein
MPCGHCSTAALSVGDRMKIILTLFMYASGCGLFLSFVEHVSALFGWPSPLGEFSSYLSFGIFVVWFPTVLVATKLAKDFKQQDFWKAVLRACPRWMKYTTFFFFGYAFINFFLSAGAGTAAKDVSSRMGSGHLMAFYSVAVSTLYSAIHVNERDKTRRCLNGHPVSPSAKFCEQCGSQVVESRNLR